ncbi:MAG: DUF1178 family protein [Deltaproteobacteria bacterium]|nr:DUF1178 family protein [Deltaproteobacteria bacterium]MBW1959924.1 DUF1178 family protein [Deltaproteobacteria bacterium]MBW2150153.1 DUF1178 family protein [Deltaproteobacteria bacterium]
MIAFDLQCEHGHTFEGWFEDSVSYEEQKKRNLIACPICNSTEVCKILSPVAIKKASPPESETAMEQARLAALGKQIVEYIHKNFDDVGCDFAQEALKMHYGVAEPRNIRGVSTPEEEKTLKKEGIQYFKLPMPPASDTDSQEN